jgi:hypothetical protein
MLMLVGTRILLITLPPPVAEVVVKSSNSTELVANWRVPSVPLFLGYFQIVYGKKLIERVGGSSHRLIFITCRYTLKKSIFFIVLDKNTKSFKITFTI